MIEGAESVVSGDKPTRRVSFCTEVDHNNKAESNGVGNNNNNNNGQQLRSGAESFASTASDAGSAYSSVDDNGVPKSKKKKKKKKKVLNGLMKSIRRRNTPSDMEDEPPSPLSRARTAPPSLETFMGSAPGIEPIKRRVSKWGSIFASSESDADESAHRSATARKSMIRRENLDASQLTMGLNMESANYLDWMAQEKCQEWLKSLRMRDPRYCIKAFFDDVARDGADSIEEDNGFQPELLSPLLSMFQRSSIFSVWRPTSVDSIRKMMTGQGTGKGLDIKGKSAKKGKLSAYVPFLQIHEDEHKSKIRPLPRDGRIRIFYKKREARDVAHKILSEVMADMQEKTEEAVASLIINDKVSVSENAEDDDTVQTEAMSVKHIINAFHTVRAVQTLSEEEKEQLYTVNNWEMADQSILMIDDYSPKCYGLDMPKRLFWEGYCIRAKDISRPPGSEYDTGRPSRASFQDMNFTSIKNLDQCAEDSPRAVVWQYTDPYLPPSEPDPDPMLPQTLLVAYEEHGRVMPVVSDFDCFLLGTRGVRFHNPLPDEQVRMVHNLLGDTEKILKDCREGKSHNWTASWLDVMKKDSGGRTSMIGSNPLKKHAKMPKYGFGDPKSYAIMKYAVQRLEEFGAVRHGAGMLVLCSATIFRLHYFAHLSSHFKFSVFTAYLECFNFYFPQELDDEFLVIGGNLGGARYKYMKLNELQEFLSGAIDLGFTFPLNPKWVVCDQGWKALWDKLTVSTHPNVQLSINAWYPPNSGVRERIEEIHKKYPEGFQSDLSGRKKGTQAWDEAEIALDRYQRIQRAKRKLWVVLCWISVVQQSQKKVQARKAIVDENRHEKNPQELRVSFQDERAKQMQRVSVTSQITIDEEYEAGARFSQVTIDGCDMQDDEGDADECSAIKPTIEPPSQDLIAKMGDANRLGMVRSHTFESKAPLFSQRFRKSSSLGSDLEENVELIDDLLNGDAPLSEYHTSGLQRIREQLVHPSTTSLSQPRINNRHERRHTTINGSISSLTLEDVPQFILDEYGGIKGDGKKVMTSFKASVKKIMNAQRVIGAIKSAEKLNQASGHFLPVEWTSLSKESKLILANKLSFAALSRWDYNIIEVAKICNGSPLLFIGWAILGSPHSQKSMAHDLDLDTSSGTSSSGYDFTTEFSLQMPILCSFLRTVEAAYLPNPYHNSIHAADVVQTLNTMLQLGGREYASSNLDLFSILVAAVIHDVCHPGLNNNFQINSQSKMAVQYNDVSVLENYSLTWFFSKLIGEEARDFTFDIFCGLSKEQLTKVRSIIIKSVLETDMTHHFALLKKMVLHQETLRGKGAQAWFESYNHEGVNHDPSMDMLCFLLHESDISNPAKPYPMFVEWADYILEESYAQGDKEISSSLPVSFLCDRATTDKKQSQTGFIKFVVQPSYQLLGKIMPQFANTVFPYITKSLDFWDSYQAEDEL